MNSRIPNHAEGRVHLNVPVGVWSVLILPKSVSISDLDLRSGMSSSTEQLVAQSSHESRIQEVLRSRWLFRAAYGARDPERGPEGEPVWPPDICGSWSHKDGHVAVLSVPRGIQRSIGIDVEKAVINERVVERVLSRPERDLFADLGPVAQMGAAGFAAKEAIFKAVFPIGQERFWFEDAAVIQIQRTRSDDTHFQMTARIGDRAGGPKSWDRVCHVDVAPVTLDADTYWLAVCGITDAALNLKS